MEGYLLIHKFL